MREKWIITGGCGFVGANLAAALLRDDIDLIVFDNLSRQGSERNLAWLRTVEAEQGAGRLEFLPLDTRLTTEIDDAFGMHAQGVSAVAHLAGQVAMTSSLTHPRRDFEINVLGSINVLEAVRRHMPTAALIFSSSNKIYGDLESLRYVETETRWTTPDFPDGFDESLALDFRTPYGCSKGAADQYFLDYHRMYGLRTVVFRHSSMYGGRQYASFDQGWVGWFCEQVLRQADSVEPFTINGDGKQVRDLLHADDVVRAYRLAVKQIDSVEGEAFNLGGGMENSLSVLELIDELARLTCVEPRFARLPPRSSDQRVFVARNGKFQDRTGFHISVPREAGLRSVLEWAVVARTGTDVAPV